LAYVKNATWATGDIITATKLNNLETQYDAAKADLDAHVAAADPHPQYALDTDLTGHAGLTTTAHGGIVPSSDVVTVATAGKILKLDANAKLPASITGDANTVDGKNPATASTADTLALRDGSGDIHARLFRSEYDSTNGSIGFIMTQVNTGTDNYMRPSTPAQVKTALGLDSTLKIATGTYTGDGTIPRTINLGFTPKYLFIKNNDSGSVGWTGLGGALRFHKDWGLFADETYGRGFEITTNGVIVGYQNNGETQDDHDTNVSTRVYNYFAIY
jgi:hypothetical protein